MRRKVCQRAGVLSCGAIELREVAELPGPGRLAGSSELRGFTALPAAFRCERRRRDSTRMGIRVEQGKSLPLRRHAKAGGREDRYACPTIMPHTPEPASCGAQIAIGERGTTVPIPARRFPPLRRDRQWRNCSGDAE